MPQSRGPLCRLDRDDADHLLGRVLGKRPRRGSGWSRSGGRADESLDRPACLASDPVADGQGRENGGQAGFDRRPARTPIGDNMYEPHAPPGANSGAQPVFTTMDWLGSTCPGRETTLSAPGVIAPSSQAAQAVLRRNFPCCRCTQPPLIPSVQERLPADVAESKGGGKHHTWSFWLRTALRQRASAASGLDSCRSGWEVRAGRGDAAPVGCARTPLPKPDFEPGP